MKQDAIIKEVRKNREQLLAQFDYDLDKLYSYLKEKEQKSSDEQNKLKTPKRPN